LLRMRLIRWLSIFALLVPAAFAETAVLECTADTSIPMKKGGLDWSGHATQLHLPDAVLLNFGFPPARDWAVMKATLLLHVASGAAPERLEIAVLQQPWDEESAPKLDLKNLRYLPAKIETKKDGWLAITVEPSLAEMLAGGKGEGLAIREPSGTHECFFHSRESLQYLPYLIVEGKPRK
jgi:hypothetical protein